MLYYSIYESLEAKGLLDFFGKIDCFLQKMKAMYSDTKHI